MRVPPRASAEEAALRGVLSADEVARADRFRFEADRRTFVLARATLRRLLGARVGVDARELVFDYNAFGKPALPIAPELRFNLSHARGAVAIALSDGVDVGVDLEQVAPRAALDVAGHYFAASECAALERCPAGQRHELFFALWTLKEAYIKAKGEGLTLPLDRFAFELDWAGADVGFVSTLGDDASDWRFHRGRALGDHAWALALRTDRDVALEVIEA